jgi:integrase
MSKNNVFTGPLAGRLRGLLEEKRALGFKHDEQERIMAVLDGMSKSYGCSNGLPKELCHAFVERRPNWRQAAQEGRVSLMRILGECMLRHDAPACLVDNSIATNLREDFKPYIFTRKQIADIFAVADRIKPNSVNSHIFYPAVLRARHGCGLRISETSGLRMKDVDFDGGVLHALNSKNNKGRDMPVSGSAIEYVKRYGRKIHPTYDPEGCFFRSRFGNGHYEKTAVNHYFRDIPLDCGIMHGGGNGGGPHLHNLRHTFCVRSLEAMLRNGIPRQAALPLPMTYMGHSSLSATGRYLKLTAEAFPELAQRINRIYGEIMPGLEVKTEYEGD